MIARLERFLWGTLRRQLVIGVALATACTLSLLIWDMTDVNWKENQSLHTDVAGAVARSIASSSSIWVSSRDFSGLQEIIQGYSQFPDLRYAIVLDIHGLILAHSDSTKIGKYLTDLPAPSTESTAIRLSEGDIDAVSPILMSDKHIGWARVGLSNNSLNAHNSKLLRDGVILGFGAICVSILIAYFASQYLTKRLYAVQRVMEDVGRGKSGLRVEMSGDDEAACLSRHLNAMLDRMEQREEQLRSFYELDLVGLTITSPDKGWLRINQYLCDLLEYSEEQLHDMTWAQLTHPDDLAKDIEQFNRLMGNEINGYTLEKRFVTRTGKVIPTNLVVRCARDSEGRVKFITAMVQDISERKDAELVAKQFQSAIDTTHDGFWIVDDRGVLAEANQSYAMMVGYELAELKGKHVSEFEAQEQSPEEVSEHMARIVERGWDIFETRHRRKDGHEIEVEVSAAYLRESRQIVCFLRDITERKAMSLALESSAKEFRLLAEAMPQIVWITRADGWNIYFNQQWCAYTGLTLEESSGAGWNKPFHPDDQKRAWEAWQNAVTNIDTYSLECRLRRADGEYFWWLIRGVPILRDDGTIEKWFGTCTDIHHIKASDEKLRVSLTELKIANEQLANERAKLEERVAERTATLQTANADLENFSYSVSHDLRAPLRAIDGFISILQDEHVAGMSDDGKRMFGIVAENARKMGDLIDDILAFSRAGRLELEVLKVDMHALAQEVWDGLTANMVERQFEFRLSDIPPISCDPRAIRQVWQNLLGNAIKFTRDRKPAVVEVSAIDEGGYVRYQVADNGVGFKNEYVVRLFVLFQRLHGMDEFEGTGVGLAIVKRFIEKHGGKVTCAGVKDQGATFSFTLPKR
jgi:PAS domain S-box-containing protein